MALAFTPEMLQQQRAALSPATLPVQTAQASRGNARLGPAYANSACYIEFDFNPATITISHTAPVKPSAGQPNTNQSTATAPSDTQATTANVQLATVDELERAKGTTTIALRELTFDGANVEANCLRLLDWSYFKRAGDETAKREELPLLKFIWGPQIYLVHVNQVTVKYTRFSPSGTPVRATVDLTLHQIPKVETGTNPTSGGPPGRRTHLLTSAESLPELATRRYGGPGHWREIAAANGFEDPLRVRPGTRVYLPGVQEAGR